MRKILAIIICCFLFLLIKNENASSKSNCIISCKSEVIRSFLPGEIAGDHTDNEPMHYDGFFIKL